MAIHTFPTSNVLNKKVSVDNFTSFCIFNWKLIEGTNYSDGKNTISLMLKIKRVQTLSSKMRNSYLAVGPKWILLKRNCKYVKKAVMCKKLSPITNHHHIFEIIFFVDIIFLLIKYLFELHLWIIFWFFRMRIIFISKKINF